MAEQEPIAQWLAQTAAENEEDEHGIQEIQELDKDDESLRKYKEALLGKASRLTTSTTWYLMESYGPQAEEYELLASMEEAPKGMLAHDSYNIKSRFTDDDKTDHLSWEWNLTIKKEWKSPWWSRLAASACAGG
uniref:Rho GDP-dissociation inhibitor 1 n=1 Tax=Lynx canadensis TaxID=61383 RepID=A0A667G2B1_LYNCA